MSGEAMVRIDSVSKSFGGIRALNNVSFDLDAGKIIGLPWWPLPGWIFTMLNLLGVRKEARLPWTLPARKATSRELPPAPGLVGSACQL